MPGTEIDDIFSGKTSTKVESKVVPKSLGGKSKALKLDATQATTMRGGKGKKRKKRKNEDDITSSKKGEEVEGASRDENEKESQEMEKPATSPMKKPKKRRRDEVEEVIDPSITVKKPRLEKDGNSNKSKSNLAKAKRGGGADDDLGKFKDSRGASGRKRTEEGYLIYTEEELGMNKEGGSTELCPFDCDCCY